MPGETELVMGRMSGIARFIYEVMPSDKVRRLRTFSPCLPHVGTCL